VRRLLVAGAAAALLLLPVVVQAGGGGEAPGGAGVVTPEDLLGPGGVRMAGYGSEAAFLSPRVGEPHSSPVRAGVLRVPEDYATVTAAVAAAQAGDVVEVSPGKYEERNVLHISQPITLRGEAGAAETIVTNLGSLPNLVVVDATAGQVDIEGLTLYGSVDRWFVKVRAPGATVRIADCVFVRPKGSFYAAIDVLDGSFVFEGNVVLGARGEGALSVDVELGDSVRVRDNLFQHTSGPAIRVAGSADIVVERNRIYAGFPLTAPVGNEDYFSFKAGIYVAPTGEASIVDNLVVVGSKAYAVGIAPTAAATRVDVLHNTLVEVADGTPEGEGAVWLTGPLDALHLRSNLIVGLTSAVQCFNWQSTPLSGSPDVAYNDLVAPDSIVDCDTTNVGDNLSVPVAFPGPDFGSYELPVGSALVDAADPASPVTSDLAGRPRPVDGDGDGTAVADIGAYESTEPAFGFITGNVVDSNPGNPIASECVYAVDSATGDLAGVTLGTPDPHPYDDPVEGGAFALGPLPSGNYRLLVSDCWSRGFPDWWFADAAQPDGIEVAVDAGAVTSGVTLAVPVPSTFVVSAVPARFCGQLYTRDGYLVASTADTFTWVIRDIPAGFYTLLTWDCRTGEAPTSYAYEFWKGEAHFDAADAVSVEAFNQNNHVTLTFEAGTWVLGRVTNAQGKPVEGILAVALDRTGFGLFGGYTDADGIYAIPGMRLNTSGFRMIFSDPQNRYGPQFLGGALTFETSTSFPIEIVSGEEYPWVPDMVLGPGLRCRGRFPTIIGFDTADLIIGTTAADVIAAQGGDDLVISGGGSDTICGGTGNDFIYGGAGGDVIDGGLGRDRLFGEGGNDTLYGGAGRDRLVGGPGTDILSGGPGTDVCVSGETLDTCP
jgi:hypothetical protein